MARLIRTVDGVLIEVEAERGDYAPASAMSAAAIDDVEKGLKEIGNLLGKACDAVKDVWNEKVPEVDVEQVQIEFGLNFEGEGNAFIARAKAGASVSVTVTLKKPA